MDRIGRYEIVSELGRGAMGVVYRAKDPKIGREVAIKTLKLADQADESEVGPLRERLIREAQSAGQLSHPGIVTVYDVDEIDGLAYIAMELVEGRTLDRQLQSGAIDDLAHIVDVIRQTSAALDYAHSKEIVHRDIKPANLMITADGVVKIMDFGIARVSSSQLTQTGTVMGTPSYMSPEQVRGEQIDGRSDQFSLGVITYQMITGKKPFIGESLTAVIFKIVSSEPEPLIEACPWVSPELDASVVRALAKQPAERFALCREYAESFAAAAASATSPRSSSVAQSRPAQDDPSEADRTAPNLPAPKQAAADDTALESEETHVQGPMDSGAAQAPAASKLPPLSRRDRTQEPPPESVETTARGGVWKFVALAAALLLLAAVGGVAASQPDFFSDPLGSARAAWVGWFGGASPDAAPPDEQQTDLLEVVEQELAPAAEGPDLLQAVEEALPPSAGATATPDPPPTIAPQSGPAEDPTRQASAAGTSGPASPPTQAAPEAVVPKPTAPKPTAPKPVVAKAAASPKARPRAKTTSVYFRTTPPGATVVVDGRAEWTCKSPCTVADLPAGRHTLAAKLRGYRPATRRFETGDAAEKILEVGLEDARIQVILTSEPDGASIFIDGRPIAEKTNAKIKLAEGTYQVRVAKEGVGEAEQVVRVDRERLPFVQFTLGRKR